MDNLLYIAYEALNKYYNRLKYIGYANQKDIDKLLLLVFLKKLMTEELSPYLTSQDYEDVEKALKCTQNCFIDLSNNAQCCLKSKQFNKESIAIDSSILDFRYLLKKYFETAESVLSTYMNPFYVDDYYVE